MSVPSSALVYVADGFIAITQAFPHERENQSVVSSEAISAAHRAHKEHRKDVALR
jgi:hypothetical protein